MINLLNDKKPANIIAYSIKNIANLAKIFYNLFIFTKYREEKL